MKISHICLGLVIALTLSGCREHEHGHDHEEHEHEAETAKHEHAPGEVEMHEEDAQQAGVKLSVIAPGEFAEITKTSGRLLSAPGAEQIMAAPVSGILRYQGKPAEGQSVSAGQTLFTITAQGTEAADASASLRAGYDMSRKAYLRGVELAKDNIISQQELEKLEGDYRAAEAMLKSAGAAAAAGDIAVKPSISGYILSINASPGEYVQAGTILATVGASRTLRLRADLGESSFGMATSAASAVIFTADGRTIDLAEHNGRVSSRGAAAGSDTHTLPVYFEFDNPGGLVNGQVVEVYLKGARRRGVITVPVEAIIEESGLYSVFVSERPEHYTKRAVTLGASDGRHVEILSGLKEGDKVVTSGAYRVKMAGQSGAVPGHTHNH